MMLEEEDFSRPDHRIYGTPALKATGKYPVHRLTLEANNGRFYQFWLVFEEVEFIYDKGKFISQYTETTSPSEELREIERADPRWFVKRFEEDSRNIDPAVRAWVLEKLRGFPMPTMSPSALTPPAEDGDQALKR